MEVSSVRAVCEVVQDTYEETVVRCVGYIRHLL